MHAGPAFCSKIIDAGPIQLKVVIQDTPEQERFEALTAMYTRNAQMVFYCINLCYENGIDDC